MAASDTDSPDAMEMIRQRLANVEADVARLKQELRHPDVRASQPWWVQRSGAFEGDPGFDEMIRLGQEWRATDRERAQQEADRAQGANGHDQ